MLGILKKLFGIHNDKQLKESIISGALLLDVRTPGEFATGNINGSINIPVDKLSAQAQVIKKDKPIIVYCRSGARSIAAKMLLEKNGFKNVIDGGSIHTVNKMINSK